MRSALRGTMLASAVVVGACVKPSAPEGPDSTDTASVEPASVMVHGCAKVSASVGANSTNTASVEPAPAESCAAYLRATEQPLGSDEFVVLVQDQIDRDLLRPNLLLVVLDGTGIFHEDRAEALRPGHQAIFRSRLTPGEHTLQLLSQLRGYGEGVCSYLRGYRVEVKSAHVFEVRKGSALCLTAQFYLRDASLSLEQRPALHFVEEYSPLPERE